MRSLSVFLAAITLSSTLVAMPSTPFTLAGQQLIPQNGKRLTITQPLSGRGQKGLANFYSDGGAEYLIKEDDPATCLLEGSAQFVREAGILPKALASAVNYASAGSINGKDLKAPLIVSIQEKVVSPIPGAQILPWDIVVYGKKRDPNTLSSFESKFPDGIRDNIAGLPPYARLRLAAAILASALAGDESLHVGQFMSALDSNKNVLDVIRIDLGARERFAVARNKLNQLSPFHASSLYQKSGQFNKDYVSYLLAENDLMRSYSMLWFKLSADKNRSSKALKDASVRVFAEQLENLPEGSQKGAIQEVLTIINKGTSDPKDVVKVAGDNPGTMLAQAMSLIDFVRANAMIDSGAKPYISLQSSLETIIREKYRELLDAFTATDSLLKAPTSEVNLVAQGATLLAELKNKTHELAISTLKQASDENLWKKLAVYGKVGMNFAEALYIATDLKNNVFEDAVRMFQSIKEVANFCAIAKPNDRKIAGAALIKGMTESAGALKLALLDKKRITDFTTDKGTFKNSPNKEGERIVKMIRSRYLLPAK